MNKGELLTVAIKDTSILSSGIAKIDGEVIFVRGTLEGDTAEVRITDRQKNYSTAECERITTASEHRITPDCNVYGICGGCSFRHAAYSYEAEIKRRAVASAFRRSSLEAIEVGKPVTASPDRYRNKAVLHFDENGKLGYYSEASRTSRFPDDCDCKLHPKHYADIIAASAAHFARLASKPTYIYIRSSEATGETVLTVGRGHLTEIELKLFAEHIMGTVPSVTGVFYGGGNTPEDGEILPIVGKDHLSDIIAGLRMKVSPASFMQVNHSVAEKLAETVCKYADSKDGELVADMYCGTGILGMSVAARNRGARVIGVEINPSAVRDAKANAELNGLDNIEFFCGDSADFVAKYRGEPSCAILDPPRRGCSSKMIAELVRLSPERIVYVSCNPATLARDAKLLVDSGYTMLEATPFDMFPRTSHVETVALLSRKGTSPCNETSAMICDDKSKYKSWSDLKKRMHDLLCDSLKGKVSYFYTSYHEVHNAYGRATINYNKKELVAFSWVEMYKQEHEVSKLYKEGKEVSYEKLQKDKWMIECKLCDADFIHSLTVYLKTDVAESLHSDDYLLRIFAYLDRRVGKRTLVKIKDEVEALPEWVKQFYQIRCDEDGIAFPTK